MAELGQTGGWDEVAAWCPACGGQFRRGFTRCRDCGVDLVDTEPEAPAPVLEDDDHALVAWDLADWTHDERTVLSGSLLAHGVRPRWAGDVLVCPATAEAEVDRLVAALGPPPPAAPPDDEDDPRPRGPVLASRARRASAAVIDFLLVSAAATLIGVVLTYGETARIAALVAANAYNLVPVALWGRTPGKRLVGTRIVDATTGDGPGWRAAAVRWGVQWLPPLLASELPLPGAAWNVVSFAVAAYPFLVYGPVLWDPRLGLHDRAARTLVVEARSKAGP